jgi:hypothetical protein
VRIDELRIEVPTGYGFHYYELSVASLELMAGRAPRRWLAPPLVRLALRIIRWLSVPVCSYSRDLDYELRRILAS